MATALACEGERWPKGVTLWNESNQEGKEEEDPEAAGIDGVV